ncbi:MAG: enoyl-CoA hydratase-related protein [Thermodesulfobacteriota bacterium]|nr:enoyl-CoA hydratase-related protein [Thermodesulfobacteriota bacterium]
MTQKDLIYRKEKQRAYITINREKQKNSISEQGVNLFLGYLDEAEKDHEVRVVCITGSGERVFCSGADLQGAMGVDSGKIFENYAKLLTRITEFPKPTLARINGHCLAGGTGFMLACDIVIARNDVKFGTPEVNVGLFPMMIGALIFRNVLRKKAMEMILLGEKLTAEDALEMGMITRAVPEEHFEDEVDSVLQTLETKSPIGMKIGKQAFNAIDTMPFSEAVTFLSKELLTVVSTKDAKEGITAFMEKREPLFKGE